MSSRIPCINIDEIASRNQMAPEMVKKIISVVQNSMIPLTKTVEVVEHGTHRHYKVERRGVGPLKTIYGSFWLFDFSIDDVWDKYSALVKSNLEMDTLRPIFKNPNKLILRTDSGCETGQLFGDLTCECCDQLRLAMSTISEAGEGIIVCIPRQDGRGMGLPFKLGTLWLQEALGVHTVESASILSSDGTIDARTYSGVVSILDFFEIPRECQINLATNNPKKASVFLENGYCLEGLVPMLAEPTEHTQHHLAAKRDYLGHHLSNEAENAELVGLER